MKNISTVLLFFLAMAPFGRGQNPDELQQTSFQRMIKMQEALLEKMKEYEGIHQKQDEILEQLKELNNKLENVENNLQGLHHEVERLKGAVDDNQESLKKLEESQNLALSGQQNLESSFHQEISGIISFLETGTVKDECSDGSHKCGSHGICINTLLSYSCSCPPGFILSDSGCQDVDECVQGIADCRENTTCINSIGSYRCELKCNSTDKAIEGLGCVRKVTERKNWQDMSDYCLDAGGRLLEDLNLDQLQDIGRTFGTYGWIGMKDGMWVMKGEPIREDLWWDDDYEPDLPEGCGYIDRRFSPSLYKVNHFDCSIEDWGLCQYNF